MIFVHDTPTNRLLNMVLGGGSPVAEYTATGNPLVFFTDLARPLKSLLIPFTPQQEGTGDPSPQNIRSILPWNGLTVFGGGKNLLNPATIRKKGNDNLWWYEQGGLFLHAGTYCFTFARNMTGFYVIDANTGTNLRSRYNSATDKFTLTEDHFIKINVYVSGGVDIDEEAMLEAGQTASTYEEYHPITDTDIVFPSAVYGGTLDVVSGVLTVTHVFMTKNTADMDGYSGENYPGWRNSGIREIIGANYNDYIPNTFCNIAPVTSPSVRAIGANTNNNGDTLVLFREYFGKTQDEWKALAIDVQLAIPLTTPQEIQLTPTQLTAIVGDNTIWSDADGSMTATYLKKG